jgi:hypothetical protein
MAQPFIPLKVLTGDTHQSYIVPAAAVTVHIPKQAGRIMMQAVTQNVRYVLDGSDPTATRGFQLDVGDGPIIIELSHKIVLRVAREAAGAVLEYEFGE